MPRVPQGGTLSTSSRRPGPPPSRGPVPPRDYRTSLVHALALCPGGSGTATCPITAGAHIYAGPYPAGPTERRHATFGRLYNLQRRPRRLLGLAGRRRDLRKTKDDTQDDCHARRHAPQCTSHSVRPLHPRDSGKNDDFHDPLRMYTVPPCVYKRRRRASFKGDRDLRRQHRAIRPTR